MFRLEIETSNDAFADGGAELEIARILTAVASRVAMGEVSGGGQGSFWDSNGGMAGTFQYTPNEED